MDRKVALVSGAAGGIGTATVEHLLETGWAVVGFDMRPPPYEMSGRGHCHVIGDARSLVDAKRGVQAAVDEFSRLDAVVCAAATIDGGKPLWETPVEQAVSLWESDVATVWQFARAAIPELIDHAHERPGRFVAIASAAGESGLFHLGGYVAAKHATVGVVRALAADLVGTGVTACAVSPGSTRTPMLSRTAQLYGIADVEEFAEHQGIRRLLEPHEIAAVIGLCCSDEGAALHGSVVHADGNFG